MMIQPAAVLGPGRRDERGGAQGGGQGTGLAGASVGLGRGVGELDDVLVAVVDGAVEHVGDRARTGQEGRPRPGRGVLGIGAPGSVPSGGA